MQYRTITLADKEQAEAAIAASGSMACHSSFVNLYMWRRAYPSEIAFSDGFMFRKAVANGTTRHYFPLGGGPVETALAKILAQDERPVFAGLTEEQTALLASHLPGLSYEFTAFRDNADYIYDTNSLITLSGKKLHGKKNHLNRFLKTYEGRWETVPITSESIEAVRAFHKAWCEKNDCKGGRGLKSEACAVMDVLDHFDALGVFGLLLLVDDKPAAYSLASKINGRVADVHVEKADTEIDGSYAIINQQMAEKMLSDFTYINREEDMGIPGLRKAKESYRPALLLMMHKGVPAASVEAVQTAAVFTQAVRAV